VTAPAPTTRLPQKALQGFAIVVALVLVWRVVVSGSAAILDQSAAADPVVALAPLEAGTADAAWRARLARNPADYVALVVLALHLEREGRIAEARDAMREALRLAPADRQTLLEAAGFQMRAGQELPALAILRRAIDLYPEVRANVFPVFVAALAGGRRDDFFAGIARDNPEWWPGFFQLACATAVDADAMQRVFAVRAAADAATADERRCIISRLQRDKRWAQAYQAWLNSLPLDQRQHIGYVFNGDFQAPISNLGFDWMTPEQDGIRVDTRPVEGATGRRALHIEFFGKRWADPPVKQYLLLLPGKYRFEGRGRADGMETWLGVQWGLYCLPEAGSGERQLARSDRYLGSTPWESFREDFTVPPDCPVQVLRLELANPRRDATAPGNVVVRLRGSLWFDDFRVRSLSVTDVWIR
jgi:tetratricopeptide (TPR) repeat protein